MYAWARPQVVSVEILHCVIKNVCNCSQYFSGTDKEFVLAVPIMLSLSMCCAFSFNDWESIPGSQPVTAGKWCCKSTVISPVTCTLGAQFGYSCSMYSVYVSGTSHGCRSSFSWTPFWLSFSFRNFLLKLMYYQTCALFRKKSTGLLMSFYAMFESDYARS